MRALWCCVLVVSAVVLSPLARAQTPDAASGDAAERRAMAEMLFFTARGLMEAERYAEACTKLAESHRLDPASGTLLNLAVCHEKEGKIASAWGEFRQAIVEARRAGRADREALAREHADALEPELPLLMIAVPPAAQQPGLQITRNGVRLAPASWSTALPVDPGTVELSLRAPGFEPSVQSIVIARRERLTMTVAPLEPLPVAEPPPVYWTRRRKAGLGLLVGGALVGGFGGVAGVRALQQRKQSDRSCPIFDGERRCTQAGVHAMDQAKRWALLADVGLAVGVVGLVTGTWLFVTGDAERARASASDAPRRLAAWSWEVSPSLRGAHGLVRRSF